MTTKIGLGVPLPLLTPVTGSWAVPFAAYYLFLQGRVVFQRLTTKTALGDTTDPSKGTKDPLYVASRSHANFVENIPFALTLCLLAELNGGNRKLISYGLGTLFALRVSHVELGLMRPNSVGVGRPLGFYGTQVLMATLAGYLGYLVKDFWQAF